MNPELPQKHSILETVMDTDTLLLLRNAEKLKYSYLINTLGLPAIAEDLQAAILYPRDGKKLIEIVSLLFDEIKMGWKQLIMESRLPNTTGGDLKLFSEQSAILISKMLKVRLETQMSEEERVEIQRSALVIENSLNTLLALKSKD